MNSGGAIWGRQLASSLGTRHGLLLARDWVDRSFPVLLGESWQATQPHAQAIAIVGATRVLALQDDRSILLLPHS